MKEIKKVLLPIDFSDTSEVLADYALTFGESFGAKIYVFNVVQNLEELPGLSVPHISMEKVMDEIYEAAREELGKFCEEHFKGELEIGYSIVKGEPYKEILKFVEENGIDIIIMGSHGRSGLNHLFFGSTAEKVLRGARCPVLTIKLAQ